MSARDDDNAGLLADYAAAHPEGWTNEDVMGELGWARPVYNKALRRFRLIFGGDEINIVCRPQGPHEPWLYKLVGTYEAARGWIANRVLDTEARIETERAVMSSILNHSDGRSVEGRKAKLIVAVFGSLQEQLAALSDQGRLWGDWTWADDEAEGGEPS